MQRSGTNFLWRLLLEHPYCHVGSVGEDFLLKHSDLLQRYSQRLFDHWTPEWRQRYDNTPDTILAQLGRSLISLIERPYYLYSSEAMASETNREGETADTENASLPQRLITKTPSVNHLDKFFKLFPDANLIIVVRDGRSVVESGMKSFGWSFEAAVRQWNQAANTIIRFDTAHRQTGNAYLIVKYEELLVNPIDQMTRILSFLQLPKGSYNFEKINELPIYGSSEIRESENAVHWKPVRKNKNFDPTQRWRQWDKRKHRRFNWIAGEAMEYFDYGLEPATGGSDFPRILNRWHDIIYRARIALKKTSRFC